MTNNYLMIIDPRVQAAIIAALISIFMGLFPTIRYFLEKKKDKRILINSQLTDFYGPLLSYLNISHTLYMVLNSNKPSDFKLLIYLLNKDQEYDGKKITLSISDHEIIKEILMIFDKIEKLIIKTSGLIDDTELRFEYIDKDFNTMDYEEMRKLSLLSRILINQRLLKLAYHEKLTDNNYNIEQLKKFTFPIAINKKIRDNIKNLQKKL
jgi:hypothetical protein